MFTIDEHHAKEDLQGLVGRIAVSTQLCYPSMLFLCLGVKLVWLQLENWSALHPEQLPCSMKYEEFVWSECCSLPSSHVETYPHCERWDRACRWPSSHEGLMGWVTVGCFYVTALRMLNRNNSRKCSFYLTISESSVHAGLVRQLDISGIRTVCQRQLLNLTVDRQHSHVVWVPLQGPPLVAHFPPGKLHVLEVPHLPQQGQFQNKHSKHGPVGIFEGRTPRLWWERFNLLASFSLQRYSGKMASLKNRPSSDTKSVTALLLNFSASRTLNHKVDCLQITLPKTDIFVTATQSLKTHL